MGMHINVETNLKVAQMIDVLRSHSGETMSSKSISEVLSQRGIDILPKTISNYLTVILKQGDYPQLSSQPRVGFVWNAAERSNDSSAYGKKSTVMRNSEGYSDPTAGTAIKNTEGEDPYARLGEVWSVNGANGLTEWFMILSDWGAVRIGIPLYMGDYRSRIRVKVDLEGIVLYGDATNIRSKPRKYFDTYVGNVGDKKAKAILNDALTAVCDPDISPTVVKEVMPANTITVDGTVYTEADIRSKLDTIITLKGHIDAYAKTVDDLDEELAFLGVVGIIGPQFWTQRISPSSKEQAFSLPLDWRVEYKQLNVSASRAALFRHNELIPTSEKDHVDYLKYSSNELALLVTTSETSDLIIPEQYWPDWKVAIIPLGEKAISELQSNRQNLKELEKIIASLKSSQKVTLATSNPAFGFLRKTLVPKGKSCVVMSYSPKALYVGGYVSLLTWFTLALTKTRRLALNRLRNFRQNLRRKENGVNSKRLLQLKDELGKK